MDTKKGIYLDYNATTPMDPRVLETMLPYFSEQFANAGSAHLFGLGVSEAVELAQKQTAALIGAKPLEVVFTSGATESINLVIKGYRNHLKKHIIVFSTEHKAVLDTCAAMEAEGFTISCLQVHSDGSLPLESLKNEITPDTLLVCAMLVNNETGLINPIKEIAQMAHEKGTYLLCDATQGVGKMPIDVTESGADFLAFSAHKFYGPKGIGGLYISPAVRDKPESLIHGGGQQRNRRSGTLNVPGIVAMGKASEISKIDMQSDAIRIGGLRDRLENELLRIGDTFANGKVQNRLYNTTNICFRGVDSERMILLLKNISVSNGAACSAVSTNPSHVLKAMGLSDADALASIRFSLGRFSTAEEIDAAIDRIKEVVRKLRI